MDLSEEIRYFFATGVLANDPQGLLRGPLVGFSSAQDPLYQELKELVGPHHLLPADILPEARTVISFFIPFSRTVVEANRRSGDEVAEEWARGYIYLNHLINTLSQLLIDFLAERGFAAETIRATHTYDRETLKAPWSHRSAAFIAGLGRFGRNRLLITPKGCAGRFGTVITAAEINPGARPQEEACLYHSGGKCSYCFDHCPIQALGDDDYFDRHRCHDRLLAVDAAFTDLDTCDVCGKCAVGPCAYKE